MGSENSDPLHNSTRIDQSGQPANTPQVNIGGNVVGDIISGDVIGGDKVSGDKVGGDKISGDVVISGQVAGDVQVTYVQRASIPAPPPPLRPPHSDLFVGRETEMAAYSAALNQAGIAVISGMAGMGKTSLAAELARRVAKPELTFWHSCHEGEGVESVIWRLAGFLASNGQGDIWRMLQNARLNDNRSPPPDLLFDYLVEEVRGQGYLLCFHDFQFVSKTRYTINS